MHAGAGCSEERRPSRRNDGQEKRAPPQIPMHRMPQPVRARRALPPGAGATGQRRPVDAFDPVDAEMGGVGYWEKGEAIFADA